ncbi:related to putative alpha-1,2-mannosidase [Saccharomycodes ludwigii]|uniref:Related to putative alpha-1,2-mannosidase n=1 Tax=Saccharomycodes ludwigii TaxID=36035 RepID=A0A376B1T9_9ASCO|nr:related to putative alpha-1,2-mannosidase [Saccharomycodes ludwigii]
MKLLNAQEQVAFENYENYENYILGIQEAENNQENNYSQVLNEHIREKEKTDIEQDDEIISTQRTNSLKRYPPKRKYIQSLDVNKKYPYLNYIDVFYGVENGGHMFPGVTLPFGMCKIGVDIQSQNGDSYSGYASKGQVLGVSMLHESGTGGSPTYGVVSQLGLTVKNLPFAINDHVPRSDFVDVSRRLGDLSHLGYYKLHLDNNVDMEFSAGYKSGIIQYTFPTESDNYIFVNVTHHLHSFGRPWWTQNFRGGYLKVNDDLKSYQGSVTISGGWSSSKAWKIYFYGEFSIPATNFIQVNGKRKYSKLRFNWTTSKNRNMGVFFQFDQAQITSHIGISFYNVDEAKKNIASDFGGSTSTKFDLDYAVRKVWQEWDNQVFSKFQDIDYTVENENVLEKFFTSIYGSQFMPTNKSGKESPFYPKSNEPYYDDWFTLWDTFRCLHPMINILDQKRASDLIRSLVNIWKFEGYMPDGRSAHRSGRTQGGSNSDIVLADAFIKDIPNVNWTEAFEAMKTNADVPPPYIKDPIAPDSTNQFGRGALNDWLKYGYITRNYSRSVTRTMEYAYNDFALYVVANGLGYDELASKYLDRSANWQKIWNFDATAEGKNYSGFIQPRDANGEFNYKKYDPLSCNGCYWRDDEYEGKPIEYGWAVPHDIQTLLEFIGSKETFIERLDDMFALYGTAIADIGNEPSFLTPYLYNFVNFNDRTSETIDYIVNNKFKLGINGLPGNSDAGAMQSWLWFALIGIYPVAGTNVYLLGTPQLRHWVLQTDDGVNTTFHTDCLYDEDDGERNIYIKSVKLNGEALTKNWVTHQELFCSDCSLYFEMSNEPTNWDADGETPPSRGNIDENLFFSQGS